MGRRVIVARSATTEAIGSSRRMETMELGEFVRYSLVQIIEGIQSAINETGGKNGRAVINPSLSHANHANPEKVEFDVAVIVIAKAGAKAGAGISVVGIGLKLGGGVDTASENQAISRIRFSVPVAWPSVAKDQYKDVSSDISTSRSWDYNPHEAP